MILVRCCVRKRGGRYANTMVGSIEDSIEALEESLSVDKVQTLSRGCSDVTNNQVNAIGSPANSCVKGTRPDLSVGGKLKSGPANEEGQTLEISKLGGRYFEETSVIIQHTACCTFITRESIRSNEYECCSGVNNANGRSQN